LTTVHEICILAVRFKDSGIRAEGGPLPAQWLHACGMTGTNIPATAALKEKRAAGCYNIRVNESQLLAGRRREAHGPN
jgi:hypothetical protein